MALYLYEVQISNDASDKNFRRFFENVSNQGAIETDYGGNPRLRALSSSMDVDTVKDLCTFGFRPSSDEKYVKVLEITKTTVADPEHRHNLYQNVLNYFQKNGAFYKNL